MPLRATVLAMLAFASIITPATGSPLRAITIDGEKAEPSCNAPSLETLRHTIIEKLKPGQHPDDAFDTTRLLLCAEASDAAIGQVFDRLKPTLRVADVATGQSDRLVRKRPSRELAAGLLRAGEAWKAEITVERPGALSVSFHADEACVHAITLVLETDRWRVGKAATACD